VRGGGGETCRTRSSRCCQRGGAWGVWALGRELPRRCMARGGVRQGAVLSQKPGEARYCAAGNMRCCSKSHAEAAAGKGNLLGRTSSMGRPRGTSGGKEGVGGGDCDDIEDLPDAEEAFANFLTAAAVMVAGGRGRWGEVGGGGGESSTARFRSVFPGHQFSKLKKDTIFQHQKNRDLFIEKKMVT
jgi:hypothetical protein